VLQCLINITIIQVTPYTDANGKSIARTEVFTFDFCHSFEIHSSWQSLSDTAVIEFPKNVYVRSEYNNQVLWGESTTPDKTTGYTNAGGFGSAGVSKAPLFMRGDEVYINAGYSYISNVNSDGSLQYANTSNTLFHGFISSVESKSNLRIHCEDYMWLLKQTTMPCKTYTAPDNDISDVLNDIMVASNKAHDDFLIYYNTGGFTLSVDNLDTGNETAADVLNKLKKILPSLAFYFRYGELRGGGIVYYPGDQHSTGTDTNGKPTYQTFNFQKNIISDELHYSLHADIKVAANCYSVNSKQGSSQNKMGGKQYFTSRVQTTVGVPKDADANAYEYYNFYFKDVTDTDDLTKKGQTYLNRYQYDGYRGNFTTFGLPFIEHGNIITITDNLLPERNGNYMVKGVNYSYGTNRGLRQNIDLHFRTDNVSEDILEQGM